MSAPPNKRVNLSGRPGTRLADLGSAPALPSRTRARRALVSARRLRRALGGLGSALLEETFGVRWSLWH